MVERASSPAFTGSLHPAQDPQPVGVRADAAVARRAEYFGIQPRREILMTNDENMTDKLKAEAAKISGKAHEEGDAARKKIDAAEAKVKADVHKHTAD